MYSGSGSDDLFRGDAIYNPECNRRDAELPNMAEMSSSIDTNAHASFCPGLKLFLTHFRIINSLKGKEKCRCITFLK